MNHRRHLFWGVTIATRKLVVRSPYVTETELVPLYYHQRKLSQMDPNDVLKELNKRNTVAVEQALKDQESKFSELFDTVRQLQSLVGTLQAQVQTLQNDCNLFRARLAGTGPSVR